MNLIDNSGTFKSSTKKKEKKSRKGKAIASMVTDS